MFEILLHSEKKINKKDLAALSSKLSTFITIFNLNPGTAEVGFSFLKTLLIQISWLLAKPIE